MKRIEKEQAVGRMARWFEKSAAVILTECRGLKVSELTELKKEIKKTQGDLRVVKNRLAKRALQGGGMSALGDYFKGPTAVAFSEADPVRLSKVILKYVESFEPFKVKVGFVGGKVLSAREVEAFSKLPTREELLACLLGTFAAPATGLVRTLQGVPQKLALTLKEIGERKQ